MSTADSFDAWCIIELFGHSRIAGKVTSQVIGSASFVRVDVPGGDGHPGFTRMFGEKAIYSITPVDEETARQAVAVLRPRPVTVYGMSQPQLESGDDDDADYDEDYDEDDDYG